MHFTAGTDKGNQQFYNDNDEAKEALLEESEAFPASAKQPFNITPAKAKVSKLTAGKNKLTIKVKDQYASGIDGYQIQYRNKGTKEWTDKTLKSGKTTLTLKKLKKGKQYEVRACGFIKIGEVEYNGKYSKIVTSDAIK